MEEGLPHPKTNVAFAPTNAFANAYPDEVETQNESFNKPTWQTRTSEEAALPKPKPAAFDPYPRSTPEPVFAYLHDDIAPLIFGAIFFVGVAYLAFRGLQWHIN